MRIQMASTQVIDISPASDGTGQGPSNTDMVRNDDYFLEKIAERWMKDSSNAVPGVTYRLARLPAGYAGYEKSRGNDSKHVDRYMYGHPNGIFRSLNEIYPHFKYLQDNGGSVGCTCKHCSGDPRTFSKKKKSDNGSVSGGAPTITTKSSNPKATKPPPPLRGGNPQGLPQGRFQSDSDTARPRVIAGNKPLDEEGTPDIYRGLIDRTKEAGLNGITEAIVDQLSPDWRVGNEILQAVLSETGQQPAYVPRLGELVLFARNVSSEGIAWDSSSQALWRVGQQSRSWLDRINWEAGIVTQTPVDPIDPADLASNHEKNKNVTYAGFRIEPMPNPAEKEKRSTKQHKYVPLHAIRPFMFWKECVGNDEQSWHPTIKNALTVASSFCLIGKYSFKGKWPEATLFCRGIFIGPELITLGDTVRLAPRYSKRAVTDVMVVSSIRLRFVDLDRASDDDYDSGRPYTTCVHVCGRAFSLDPKRSADGIGKTPVKSGDGLPELLNTHGQWFKILSEPEAKLELPYNRILGRCYEDVAVKAWFATPNDIPPRTTFQAVNSQARAQIRVPDLSRGYEGVKEARDFSRDHDSRIEGVANQSWFWADTRIEQLDLHEMNDTFVGVKDETRSKRQVNAWRRALKVLDGNKGASEEHWTVRNQRPQQMQPHSAAQIGHQPPSESMNGIRRNSSEDDDGLYSGLGDDGDAMEVEESVAQGHDPGHEFVDLTQNDDDDDELYE